MLNLLFGLLLANSLKMDTTIRQVTISKIALYNIHVYCIQTVLIDDAPDLSSKLSAAGCIFFIIHFSLQLLTYFSTLSLSQESSLHLEFPEPELSRNCKCGAEVVVEEIGEGKGKITCSKNQTNGPHVQEREIAMNGNKYARFIK